MKKMFQVTNRELKHGYIYADKFEIVQVNGIYIRKKYKMIKKMIYRIGIFL